MRTQNQKPGFTLTELMIVIAIFVVMLAMAVPLFRGITGTRSVASGINLISATLARVRLEAMGFERHRGVMFYLDQNTGRVGMVPIAETTPPAVAMVNGFGVPFPPPAPQINADIWFDVVDGVEPALLPQGVGVEAMMSFTSTNRYIGFNRSYKLPFSPNIQSANRYGFIVAFTPEGRLFTGTPGTVWWDPVLAQETNAANLLFGRGLTLAQLQGLHGSSQFYPTVALTLFESDAFLTQFASGSNDAWWDDSMYGSTELRKEQWLDTNATPILINRYNGTLIKGE